MHKNIKKPVILKSEVRQALTKKKRNKEDKIVREMLTALDDLGDDKVTKVINI